MTPFYERRWRRTSQRDSEIDESLIFSADVFNARIAVEGVDLLAFAWI